MLRVVLAIVLTATQTQTPAPASLTLDLRVFDGQDDVTRESRAAVYRAGDRREPIATLSGAGGPLQVSVPAGFYDVQAVREKGGRVAGIRWAERLVVMAYPDEAGRHLEVVNLRSGFGALQVRSTSGRGSAVAIFATGARDKEAAVAVAAAAGALFVVPAGSYDLRVRNHAERWLTAIDVPADRTRLWVIDRP